MPPKRRSGPPKRASGGVVELTADAESKDGGGGGGATSPPPASRAAPPRPRTKQPDLQDLGLGLTRKKYHHQPKHVKGGGWKVVNPGPAPTVGPRPPQRPEVEYGKHRLRYSFAGFGGFQPPASLAAASKARLEAAAARHRGSVNGGRAGADDGPAEAFRKKVAADPKRAKTRHTLKAALSSSSPLSSTAWWLAKHPITRLASCVFVTFANLFVYYGDPATYSPAKSYGTLVGDIYHGWFQPDVPGWLTMRLLVMCLLGVAGLRAGLFLQRRVLRDGLKLALFG